MKVLVTGTKGQLGYDVAKELSQLEHDVFAFSREGFDITDQQQVNHVIGEIKPDVIIHAAAYTKVDQAEIDKDQAYLVNAFGTRNLAVAAENIGAKLCYISTDYVFNGKGQSPYHEYADTCPLGVYGHSKYAGEELVKTLSTKYFIVRTAWVYGMNGQNFVKTMLKLAHEKDELGVVHDQVGSPTYTVDLAKFLIELVQTEKYGIYHGTNSGSCSWYEFAKAIFEEAGIAIKVNPLTTEQFPRPAQRPAYSVLGDMALRLNGFTPLRHWREALQCFLKELES